MYKNIAITVDSSESSAHALDQALALAAAEESKVLLISVIPAYEGDLRIMGDSSVLEAMRQPYVDALDRAVSIAAARKVEYKKLLLSGDPGEQLLVALEQEQADLVVIGRRASRLNDLIPIGSVSAKLLKLSEIDVLVIPLGTNLEFTSILVAYDGSQHATKAATKACTLALRYGTSYLLATIYELSLEGYALSPGIAGLMHKKAAKQQQPIIDQLKERGVRQYKSVIEHGDPVYWALSELATRNKVGLAVLGSRGAGNLSKILLGSVTARFISSGTCPTLIVKQS